MTRRMSGYIHAFLESPYRLPVVPRLPKSVPGFVYVVRAHEVGQVKIGFSRAPLERLYDLQKARPDWIEMVAVFVGDVRYERSLQAQFASDVASGEWFYDRGDVRVWVDALATDLLAAA